MNDMATTLTPVLRRLAPTAYANMVRHKNDRPQCHLGHNKGRPFAAVTATRDFRAHWHTDKSNMLGGCTTVSNTHFVIFPTVFSLWDFTIIIIAIISLQFYLFYCLWLLYCQLLNFQKISIIYLLIPNGWFCSRSILKLTFRNWLEKNIDNVACHLLQLLF